MDPVQQQDSTVRDGSGQADKFRTPVPAVCPDCREDALYVRGESIVCTHCDRVFPLCDGYPDLIIGERFEDETSCGQLCYEEEANSDTTLNYWLPLFQRLWPQTGCRLLSVGCGSGLDVDVLSEHGFDVMGIDSGNRSCLWRQRREQTRLLLANGMRLPFAEDTFDAAFCGCVYPHVGVVGDSNRVRADVVRQRSELAREMVRVLKPGGRIIVSSPNRLFPLDLFHGREPGDYLPRINLPWSRFLLSRRDYQTLFTSAGTGMVRALPVENYWGFVGSKNSLKGRLLSLPIRFVFWLVSRRPMAWLRVSPLNPWIVVMAEKL